MPSSHSKFSGFICSVSPCIENGWGNLNPVVIIYYVISFSLTWFTFGIYFSVFAIFEKKQKF